MVSIHAQCGGWAKPGLRCLFVLLLLGFNPRPARWLGETPPSAWMALSLRCFNPRPARWLGETGSWEPQN